MCIFAFGLFSSPCNFFHVVYPFGFSAIFLFVLILGSKIVLFPSLLVVGISSCIPHLFAGRIFFLCFEMSCFVCIIYYCII